MVAMIFTEYKNTKAARTVKTWRGKFWCLVRVFGGRNWVILHQAGCYIKWVVILQSCKCSWGNAPRDLKKYNNHL